MRKTFIALLFALAAAAGPAAVHSAQSPLPPQSAASPLPVPVKATWLWNTRLIDTAPSDVVSFSQRQGLNLIYLQVDRSLPLDSYRSFIRSAHAAGIQVYALDGEPEWGLRAGQNRIVNFVSWVRQYNSAAGQDERFSGIQLDVEPYLLPEWRTHREDVIQQWTANVERFVQEAKTAPALSASAALPFWLDQENVQVNGKPVPLSRWMIERLDHVALMAYRDSASGPNGIAALVQNELKDADALGKSVVIGVNLRPSEEGSRVTFFEEGPAEMNRQVDILYHTLGGHRSFAGHAVHDYAQWRRLSPGFTSQ